MLKKWWPLVVIVLLVAVAFWQKDATMGVFYTLADFYALVTSKTSVNDAGTVCVNGQPADPQALADENVLDLDTYSLARMVQSEAGSLGPAGMKAVGFAARNYAQNANKTLSALLLRASGAANGFYGKQDQGRYAATSRDPSQSAIEAAITVMAGYDPDPTGGADQWDSPWAYSDPARADVVAAARMAAGKSKVTIPGIPERKLRFWRLG